MYTDFAKVYDIFMKDIPYDEWCQYLVTLLKDNGIDNGNIVELGCGTGQVTRRLYDAGYSITGTDISQDMLSIAVSESGERDITYACMDMRKLELPKPVDAIVSICDSVNYLIEDGDLKKLAKGVYRNLRQDGVFVFDLKTEYFYEKVLGDDTFAENEEDASYIWENIYDPDCKINEYYLNIFIKDPDDGRFDRFEECHYQRAYSIEEVMNAFKTVDFSEIKVYNAFTKNNPGPRCQRYYVVCKR